ncbi:MAG: ribonuclease J [Peptococcaceae bacterium]|jgi:ribonuclease J|nr:ribonuclease J [Peptococcaceae bacterium]
MVKNQASLQVIPLGGLGEIGKNMTVFRYEDEMIVVDAGLMFPGEEMLGIDVVIPDYSYLLENKELLMGILLTHGHEDHIGAMPYILRDIEGPVYASRLTLGLLQDKLKEHGVSKVNLNVVKPHSIVRLGKYFQVEFFRVTHSIPGCFGLAITTPVGTVVHTGDFKMDQTPVDGESMDFGRLAELGRRGVLVLMADSTNVERPGFTRSEKEVGGILNSLFGGCEGRIILATFASNVHRIQQVLDAAFQFKRKVAVVGRSMINVVGIAQELQYLRVPDDTVIDIDEIGRYAKNRIVVLCTGSQGEPMSALTRMANNDHRRVEIMPGDTVVISATPIPGNEKLVGKTVNQLYRLGAEVVHEASAGVHASGHASQEELKLMLNLVRPKFFMPVHGEYRHLAKHAQLAHKMGIPSNHVFVGENGQTIEFTKDSGQLSKKVTAGQILVDGLGVGDVGNVVLRDRKQLSEDGMLLVVFGMRRGGHILCAGPDIVSRGFVYVKEADGLLEEARDKALQIIERCGEKNIHDWAGIKGQVREGMARYLYERTRRRPMILPVILEV